MKKICTISGKEFEISKKENDFLEKITPIFDGQKFPFPESTVSPNERIRNITAHRNEQYLYHAKSCFSKKPLISVYPENFSGKLCSREEWFSDIWDPMEFGKDFDFSRTFFENYADLQKEIPRAATVTIGNENCEYTTGTGYCRNCYLINSSEYAEDCMYSKLIQKGRDILDSSYAYDSELLYECFNVKSCYDSRFLHNCKSCRESWFLKNCIGCKNCFGCVNLRQKQYYFLNKKLTKEEYEKKITELALDKRSSIIGMRKNFLKFALQYPQKYAEILNCENCTGDFLIDSKNCVNCYDVEKSEDVRNVYVGGGNKDVQDATNVYVNVELCYETLGALDAFNIDFCMYIFHSQNMLYCEQCFNCKDCFGCIGLRKKQHCIFNKQFTKKEYEKKVVEIITHMKQTNEWGSFFPIEISPFPYNKTLAHTYFPMTKKEVLKKGWKWEEDTLDKSQSSSHETLLPDSIADVPDSICGELFSCKSCNKNYKIQKQELKFYKKSNIPLPEKCPDCRHLERMTLRNPRELWNRKCNNCSTEIQTTFPPDRSEKVFCEKCYSEAIN